MRAAWNQLRGGEPARAAEILPARCDRLSKYEWIEDALEHLEAAPRRQWWNCACGPLGLLGDPTHQTHVDAAMAQAGASGSDKRSSRERIADEISFAGGRCGKLLRFSPAAGDDRPDQLAQQPDLGLLAEPGVPIATIERREDEYFIRGSAVAVNDRPNQSASRMGKLLATGDRIALSPRCRMIFAMPSAASTTAVLDLTGCRYPRLDVRRIILLDRDIVLGASLASHVRVEGAEESVVLHIRGGRLFCESKLPVEVNGSPMDRMSGIPMEAHVKTGSVSFVVSES